MLTCSLYPNYEEHLQENIIYQMADKRSTVSVVSTETFTGWCYKTSNSQLLNFFSSDNKGSERGSVIQRWHGPTWTAVAHTAST